MRIVIADDHALFRGGLRLHLASLDPRAELVEAGSFDQVLDLLDLDPPADLVILDLAMPGPRWQDCVPRLHGAWPRARLVVLTANDEAGAAQQALAIGAHGFILKSEPPDLFAAALRLILSGGRYFPVSVLGREPAPFDPPPPVADSPPPGPGVRAAHAVTGRQREVLTLMASGCSNKEIAWRLKLTEGTVKLHVAAILRALGAHNRTQAVSVARACGLLAEP